MGNNETSRDPRGRAKHDSRTPKKLRKNPVCPGRSLETTRPRLHQHPHSSQRTSPPARTDWADLQRAPGCPPGKRERDPHDRGRGRQGPPVHDRHSAHGFFRPLRQALRGGAENGTDGSESTLSAEWMTKGRYIAKRCYWAPQIFFLKINNRSLT